MENRKINDALENIHQSVYLLNKHVWHRVSDKVTVEFVVNMGGTAFYMRDRREDIPDDKRLDRVIPVDEHQSCMAAFNFLVKAIQETPPSKECRLKEGVRETLCAIEDVDIESDVGREVLARVEELKALVGR